MNKGKWILAKFVNVPPNWELQPMSESEKKWSEEYEFEDVYICSVCKQEPIYDTDYGDQLTPYCPWCGAEMVHIDHRKKAVEKEQVWGKDRHRCKN